MADPEDGCLEGIVDLDRFPLHQRGSAAWIALVDQMRAQLAAEGCATLRDFLRPDALASTAAEIAALATHVPIRVQRASVYRRTSLERGLPADDPRRIEQSWNAGHVTRDMIPPFAASHRLYVSSAFKAFVAACVGSERAYEYADPLAGLVATILPPGGCYPWHYDTNEFVVTIMTQAPEAGGAFEYHQDLRTPGDENLDGLAAVLDGRPSRRERTVSTSPGDLQLFLGRYSLHQVTEVAGSVDRHVLVLSYAEHPGVIGPVDRTRSVYGRVTEAHLVAERSRLASSDGLIL
ncbi:HalD/BesD family halogenase [Ilumatobacter sp.]|uniref:HalD/BesD family halogenase n=1 Tax=Ilumatobacter sp. TaxID=1967498 RepID=UPI003B52F97F